MTAVNRAQIVVSVEFDDDDNPTKIQVASPHYGPNDAFVMLLGLTAACLENLGQEDLGGQIADYGNKLMDQLDAGTVTLTETPLTVNL